MEAQKIFEAPKSVMQSIRHVKSQQHYLELCQMAKDQPEKFWAMNAEKLKWIRPFKTVVSGCFEKGDLRWFEGGKINVSENCIDRWVESHPDRVAILWEGDEPTQTVSVTYRELLAKTCQLANALKFHGIRKGDSVGIYLPNCPEVAIAMLACARIGAIHTVIFAGFSAESLVDRLNDASCKLLITADEMHRGAKLICLKKIADEALKSAECVKTVFLLQRECEKPYPLKPNRDYSLIAEMNRQRPYCPPEEMDAEDPLFLLYTSGSTGKPKGILHTQAGYLLFASLTHLWTFDIQPNDIYGCVADVGWITGHSYIVYGPLCNGTTTFMFESVPTYPDVDRYWQMIEKYKFTQFYTSPTAIRALMRFDKSYVEKYDLSSLRIIGTVGEPINLEAWMWLYEHVGKKKCSIVDTFWQTESGGHLLTSLPSCQQKPGAAAFGFPGIEPVLLDGESGKEITGFDKSGVLAIRRPWPGLARSVYGNHERYMAAYLQPYPGFYFTGDNGYRDKDGMIFITGRVDDVLNVSGHRLGTAEIESSLVLHAAAAEAAVVGIPHEIKGQAIFAFVLLKHGEHHTKTLETELRNQVRSRIGAFASPDHILIVEGLPKTRSGKIMRRILRKIACQEYDQLGDITTLADPSVVEELIQRTTKMYHPDIKKAKIERD